MTPKITPCLWFDGKAEEAAKFYVSLFNNSKILNVTHYTEVGKEDHGQEAGSVMTVDFELEGQRFMGLNGGSTFKFTEAVSFVVDCDDQAEVDKFWNALTADGGEESVCGWLKDKYGMSWQITPKRLVELLSDPVQEKADRVMAAMMKMRKIDIAALEKAHRGE